MSRLTGFPPRIKRIIRNRAEQICEKCGEQYGVHAHHRRVLGMGGDRRVSTNLPGNGVWLCLLCHDWVHRNPDESMSNGWLVSQSVAEPVSVAVVVRGRRRFLTDDGGYLEDAA